MKLRILLLAILAGSSVRTFSQSLGHYAPASITAGGNVNVTPNISPNNTTYIQVIGSAGFLGVMTAKPSTGVVNITNAKPVGSYIITVKAFSASGSSITRTFPLTVGKPRCSVGMFHDTAEINTGLNQINVAIGDFNRDGKQDFASAHEGGNNTVSIRLGNGLGGFSGNTEVSVGSHPYCLVIGDYNRDGKQDLAVSCQGGNIFSICLGDGSGNFSSGASFGVGRGPVGIITGDFDEDGKLDIATCNLNGHSVSVRLGNGTGSFSGHTEVPVDSFPYAIVIGDFNTDNHMDLATVSGGEDVLSIRFGDGDGHFSGNSSVPVGSFPYGLTVGDFNNDNNLDLVSSNFVSNTLSIRLGDGLGNFSGNTEVPVGDGAYSVTAGNLNGDANLDLASVNYFDNTVSIKLGDGMGHFSGNTLVPTGSYPITIAVGEFNNDRKPDIIVSNYLDHSASILLGVVGVPPIASISSNSPVCLGQNIELFADGDSTYSWVGPDGYFSSQKNPVISTSGFNNAGLYTVTVTNSSNCSAVASTIVNIFPLPAVSFTLAEDTLCYGVPVQNLSGGNPANGTYSGSGVISVAQFNTTFSGPGVFPLTYSYTDNHGCSNSAIDHMTVLICNGVNETSDANNLSVFPNPVKDEFKVDLPSSSEKYSMQLFSPEGKIVKEWNDFEIQNKNFSIGELSEGIYYLGIYEGGQVFFRLIYKTN